MPYWIIKFIRRYWKHILLLAGIVVAVLYVKTVQSSWALKYENLQIEHRKEIEQIEKIRLREQQEHERNFIELQDELKRVKVDYELKKKELENKKSRIIKEITESTKKDPRKLAEELSSVTGIVVNK